MPPEPNQPKDRPQDEAAPGAPAPQPGRLRIAVLGAGSIGCHVGGLLSAVADVTLIGRPAAMAVLADEGLTLTGGGRAAVRIPGPRLRTATSPDAVRDADLVLVTVKSAGTAAAGAELAGRLAPGAAVVSLQNGLHNAEVLRAAIGGGHPVIAGMVPYNVLQTAPGVFHQGSGGALMVEASPGAGARGGAPGPARPPGGARPGGL
ncbi:2-dehydropantoate 2-reductase N-terminal domain-containing protein, partial [Kitasatospora sp. NPDC059571]|uniref:2-dehydropantoate 2-reductase N-terminal domain-containing protein n=1 Tax=Kitasatospora sp. NPDC059571 TaxID=3346871 RepID=UPI00367A3AE9